MLRIEAIKERKFFFIYNCAWLNGNEIREKNSDSLCNRSGFIQVHFRLVAMKICVYQLTQSHTRGELSEPDSTQRLLQSTEKKENYYFTISFFRIIKFILCSLLLLLICTSEHYYVFNKKKDLLQLLQLLQLFIKITL